MMVLGAGLVTADITAMCTSDWRSGGDVVYSSGGTVTNILSHLGYWGWPCHLLGGVGDDVLGTAVVRDLNGYGVSTDGIYVRAAHATRRIGHLVAVTGHRRGSHRFLERCFECDNLFPPFEPLAIEEAPVLLLDEVSPDTILLIDRANSLTLALARLTKERGGVVVFEPGYLSRNHDVVVELLGLVDMLKYSEELVWESVPFNESKYANPAQAGLVIETRGNTGVIGRRGDTELRLTTTPVMNVVDTAGAGDAFMAGFLTGLGSEAIADIGAVSDDALESALERGQALGALACNFVGATSMIRDVRRDDLNEALEQTMTSLSPPSGFGNGGFSDDWIERSRTLRDRFDTLSAVCHVCLLPRGSNVG